MALHASGELPEAIAWYRKVIQAQPANAEAHFLLGKALAAVGRRAEADECFRAAGRLDPSYSPRPWR